MIAYLQLFSNNETNTYSHIVSFHVVSSAFCKHWICYDRAFM